MTHVMLDLETMGTSSNAAIVAIGAVEFNPVTGELGDIFYEIVDLNSSVENGGVIEADTVLWWLKQGDAARAQLHGPAECLISVLVRFAEWIPPGSFVWGNGAGFDNVVLANAYKAQKMSVPWDFRNDRCYRTMKALAPNVKMQRTGTAHSAIGDAVSQANHLMEIYKELDRG